MFGPAHLGDLQRKFCTGLCSKELQWCCEMPPELIVFPGIWHMCLLYLGCLLLFSLNVLQTHIPINHPDLNPSLSILTAVSLCQLKNLPFLGSLASVPESCANEKQNSWWHLSQLRGIDCWDALVMPVTGLVQVLVELGQDFGQPRLGGWDKCKGKWGHEERSIEGNLKTIVKSQKSILYLK